MIIVRLVAALPRRKCKTRYPADLKLHQVSGRRGEDQ